MCEYLMNEKKARSILGPMIEKSNDLSNAPSGEYVEYIIGFETIALNGDFTVEQLEALAWWMRNMKAVIM